MHFFLHVRQVSQVFFLRQMPDWSIESFEVFGFMAIFLILPDSSKSGTFQEYIQEIFLAAEFQSRCNLRKSITVIQFLLIHPCRFTEVEHQHFADLRIRQPAGMPAGDESSLRLDIDAGGKRLDGVAGVIAGCVVFHFNLPFTLVNLLK